MNTEGKVTYKYIVYIQFEESKKAYTFGSNVKYYTNDIVVVETVRGQELGKVCVPTVDFDASKVKGDIKPVLRKATPEDIKCKEENVERAKEAMKHDQQPLYELYKELAGDEIVHAAQLRTALEIFGMQDKLREIQGRLEAQSTLGIQITEAKEGEEDEHTKKMRKLREEADKAKKDFDFAAEYTRDKIAQARARIVDAINNIIIGKEDVAGAVETIMKDGKAVVKTEKQHKGDTKSLKK